MPEIGRNVEPGAMVCTDASASYANLAARFIHRAIDHTTSYVVGQVHINGMDDGDRFAVVMKSVLGKRLTFRVLCAIDDAGFMGLT